MSCFEAREALISKWGFGSLIHC